MNTRIPRKLIASLFVLVALPLLLGFTFPGSVQRLWRQADRAFGRKQYDRAAELYSKARTERPQEWVLPYNAAVAQAFGQKYEQALPDLQQVATNGPQQLRETAEYNSGNCYLSQGQADQAIEHYKRALYLKPDDMNAKWNLELAKKKQQQQQQQQQQPQPKPQNKPQEKPQPKQSNKQQQQQQQKQMDREQAKQLLQSLSQQDRDLQKKLARYRNQPASEARPSQDW